MSTKPQKQLQERVIRAAEAALADHSYVSPVDVMRGIGWLADSNIKAWRNGQIDCLERVLSANLSKISSAMAFFHRWAVDMGLKPSETHYVRRARNGSVDLQFSKSGDPQIEKAYRTHYVSPALSERKQKNLQEKLDRPPQNVVFQVLRDTQCAECGAEVRQDSLLMMEAGEPLCLSCARFDDLEYLPSGDAALTRRATKYSSRVAVVVRFSRARKRYERQGILVEIPALERAESESTEDAEERADARRKSAERRQAEDRALVVQMAQRIRVLFPGCPASEAEAIARHTATRGSGRVGRTAAGRSFAEQALTLAVAADIRHNHTGYDELLASGLERSTAREQVSGKVNEVLAKWRS